MTEISMLGLGRMGGPLAHQLQRGGHSMTVWNRSPEKMKAFTDKGAQGAQGLVEAVSASPVILICVDDYSVTRSLFDVEIVRKNLVDRTVVQLSTGTPLEAHESESWFNSHSARYLDGAILGGGESLATEDAQLIFSGSEEAFLQVQYLLNSLCPRIRYLGENIRSACALDFAWLCRHLGMFMGVNHGAILCESEGVSLDLYAQMFPQSDYAHEYINTMQKADFTDTSATLRIWLSVLNLIRKQASEAGINSEIPDYIARQFEQGVQAGYGEEDVAAVIKILRRNRY